MSTPVGRHPNARTARRSLCLTVAAHVVLAATLSAQTAQTQWMGVNSAWSDPANWNAGVPTTAMDAVISRGAPAYADPIIPSPLAGDTARAHNLVIQSGGTLWFATGGVLVVEGDERSTNDGIIELGEGRLILRGDTRFLNGGSFLAQQGTVVFEGTSWESKSGSAFDPGTSTVIFDGNGNQTINIASGATLTFYNLQVFTVGTLTLTGGLTVTNDCTIGSTATVDVPSGSTFQVDGTVTNDGTVTGSGTLIGIDQSMPVQLTSFQASSSSSRVVLRWTTATESNNRGWDVQRREIVRTGASRAQGSWRSIDFVPGSGTVSSPRSYTYQDGVPPSRYAYRLVQWDRDGRTTTSQELEIATDLLPQQVQLLEAYPNPFNPSTTVRFSVEQSARTTVAIYSVLGARIATLFDGPAEPGRLYEARFIPEAASSSVYFLRLQNGDRSTVRRLLFLK